MKKSILTIQLLIAAFFLSMPLAYSSSYTNCNLPKHVCAKDEPTVACGVQINSVLPIDRAGSNDVTFIANVTLQSNTLITNAFFDFTFESGRTSSLSGSTPEATFPVSCYSDYIGARGISFLWGSILSKLSTGGLWDQGVIFGTLDVGK